MLLIFFSCSFPYVAFPGVFGVLLTIVKGSLVRKQQGLVAGLAAWLQHQPHWKKSRPMFQETLFSCLHVSLARS